MSNKFLPIFVSNARYANQKLLPRLLQGGGSPADALEFCANQRRMGIGALLLLGDSETFQSHLYRSGRAFLALVLQAGGASSVALSRMAPFFDALAARDAQGARQVATLAPRARQAGIEYEEDFLYVCFLMDHGVLGGPEADARACLERFESVLEGSEEPRLEVCQALLARDGQRLEEALQRLVSARLQRYVRLREQGRLLQEEWAMEAKVCVEGLALLALAEELGVKTPRGEYPGLPSVARLQMPPSEPADSWTRED
ncbi:Imm49 family immunity protein [Pyxidicoccus sp. 3LG]